MSIGYFIAESAKEVDLASHCYDTAQAACDIIMDMTTDGEWPEYVVVEIEFSNGKPVEISTVEFGPPT